MIKALTLLAGVLAANAFETWSAPGSSTKYLLASFPKLGEVHFTRLPDATWKPLVSGLKNPTALAVDEKNLRLFVADPATSKVFWFQYQVFPNGNLATDAVKRVAMKNVSASALTVDEVGNLYVAGRLLVEGAAQTVNGIFKQPAVAIATGTSMLSQPARVWTKGDGSWVESKLPGAAKASFVASSPAVSQPSALVVDPFFVYWGNSGSVPNASNAVARGLLRLTPPTAENALVAKPPDAPLALADNAQSVTGMTVTPAGIYYATQQEGGGAIYGMASSQAPGSCVGDHSKCPLVAKVAGPTALAYDGESTVFVADSASGAVWSFASNVVAPHNLDRVADADGIQAIAIVSSGAAHFSTVLSLLAACLFFLRF